MDEDWRTAADRLRLESAWLELLVRPVYDEASRREALRLASEGPGWGPPLGRARAEGLRPRLGMLLQSLQGAPLVDGAQARLRWERMTQIAHTMRILEEMGRLLRALQRARVDVICFKGPVLAEVLHADAAGREYGDLDLLVPRNQRHRAGALLEKLGYQPLEPVARGPGSAFRFSTAVSFSAPGRTDVDLHWGLSTPLMPFGLVRTGLGSRTRAVRVGDVSCLTFRPEDTLLHLCFHAAKDDWCGWSAVADVAALLHVERGLDLELLRALACRTGTCRLLHVGLLVASGLAKAPLPTELSIRAFRDRSAVAIAQRAMARLRAGGAVSQSIRDRVTRMLRLREQPRDCLLALLGIASRVSEPRPGEAGSPWSWPLRRPLRILRDLYRDDRPALGGAPDRER